MRRGFCPIPNVNFSLVKVSKTLLLTVFAFIMLKIH